MVILHGKQWLLCDKNDFENAMLKLKFLADIFINLFGVFNFLPGVEIQTLPN